MQKNGGLLELLPAGIYGNSLMKILNGKYILFNAIYFAALGCFIHLFVKKWGWDKFEPMKRLLLIEVILFVLSCSMNNSREIDAIKQVLTTKKNMLEQWRY